MRNFIAAIFTNERNAFEGLYALRRLDAEGAITVHEADVIERAPDGTFVPRYSRTNEPPLRRTGIGALVGLLAGLSGGPVGVAIGGAVGVLGGVIGDAIRSEASEAYVETVGVHMQRGTFAVIADVHETDTRSIDSRIAELGGNVLRQPQKHLVEELVDEREERRRAAASGISKMK